MGALVYSILSFVIALGILIAFHEFGHFWVARRLGVKVLRFSIGFGKPLWSTKRGPDQTEYSLSALPLGGYVKMLDEREGEVAQEELHRAFNRQPLGTRFAIVAAGPVFNFLLAAALYWAIFVAGIPGLKAIVGDVAPDSRAAQAGLQTGDHIVAVNGKDTKTLEAFRLALLNGVLDAEHLRLRVEGGDGSLREVDLDLTGIDADEVQNGVLQQVGLSPQRPKIDPIIGRLESGGAAADVGLQVGDRIVALNGEAVDDWMTLAKRVREHPGESISLTVMRDGERRQFQLTPARVKTEAGEIGRIGAAPQVPENLPERYLAEEKYSVFGAVPAALGKTWDMSKLTLEMLWKMLVGQASLENISGPISIAQFAGQSAQVGLVPFLSFLAIVSISLGVLNLLPVPVLDGGHLMYYVIEFVKGSPLSEQAQMAGQKVGLALLLSLMLLAFYNDISRLLG